MDETRIIVYINGCRIIILSVYTMHILISVYYNAQTL